MKAKKSILRKSAVFFMVCFLCFVLCLFFPLKAKATDIDEILYGPHLRCVSISTTHATVKVTDESYGVSYNYKSVTAEVGNKKYSMKMTGQEWGDKIYSVSFPTPAEVHDKVKFTAVTTSGKVLTETETIYTDACEIKWERIDDDYSLAAEAETYEKLQKAYSVGNGKKQSARIVRGEYGDSYRIIFPMEYPPKTVIEACIVVNGCTFSKKYTMPNIPPQTVLEKITSSTTKVKGSVDRACTVKVRAKGKSYSKKCAKDQDFSIKIPQMRAGSTVTITVTNDLGHTYSKNIKVKQGKSYMYIERPVHCADGYVVVYAEDVRKNDVVEITVGRKKYRKKITSTKNDQYIKVKVGKMKKNAVITAKIYDKFKGLKGTGKAKVTVLKSSIQFKHQIFCSTTNVQAVATNVQKGDKIELKIGSATYRKKVTKNAKKKVFNFQIQNSAAGSWASITAYDKYGNKKGSNSTKVYYGTTIWIGMPTDLLVLTTWGYPNHINTYSDGLQQWVYTSGSSRRYVYVRGGVVVSYQLF